MKIVSYKIKTSIQYIFPESFLDPWKSYGLTKYIKLFFSDPPQKGSQKHNLYFLPTVKVKAELQTVPKCQLMNICIKK